MPLSRRGPAPSRWFGVRDRVSGTRVAGIFALSGAAYVAATSLLLDGAPTAGGRWTALAVVLLLTSLGLPAAVRPTRVPQVGGAVLAAVAVLAVLHLDLVTRDATFGGQIYLVWPVLYAAYHLRTRGAWVLCVQAVLAHAVLMVGAGGPGALARDTVAFSTTALLLTWMLSTARDRAEASFDRVRSEASEDVLTGLASRRAFEDALRAAWAGEGPLAVVLCDIDHFKTINDGDGHALGDRALQAVAGALQEAFGAHGVVGRYGGDELVVVLAGPSVEGVLERAEAFRARVEALRVERTVLAPTGSPAHLRLTVSVGVVTCPGARGGGTVEDCPRDPAALLTAADQALYAAKRAGRNRVVRAGHPDDATVPLARGAAAPRP